MATDPKLLLDALASCVSVALQDGAFILCWPVEDAGDLAAPAVDASVALALPGGPLTVGLSLSAALAQQVAVDTLGEIDPASVAEGDVQDAVMELANVVAGRLAPRVAEPGALVRIAAPVAHRRPPPHAVFLTLQTDSGAHLRCWLAGGDS